MNKFKKWWVSFGTGSIIATFILGIYEIVVVYQLSLGFLAPLWIFLILSAIYFGGNCIFMYLSKLFDKVTKYIKNKNRKMEKRRSPLRLPNGKFRVKDEILALFPEKISEFRDVRMGAGHITFHTLNNRKIERYWLNEENPDVVNFFKYASYFNSEVESKVKMLMNKFSKKELFDECKRILKHEKSKSIDEDFVLEASAFYIINRLSYAGTLTGGYCQDNWINGKTPRLTASSIKNLRSLDGFIKSGIRLTSMDCLIPIKATTSLKDKKEVFLFVNVPFVNEKMQMYKNSKSNGNLFDYKSLANLLAQTDYKFMVVVDDCKMIRDLFAFANIVSLDMQGDIYPNKVRDGNLLAITNY